MKNTLTNIFKKAFKIGVLSTLMLALVAVFMPAGTAFAMTPTLSVSSYGSNSQIQVTVNGDQNQNIQLYYYSPAGSSNLVNAGTIGTTNASGYFSTILNANSYNIPSGTTVFVIVNGQQSTTSVWPSTSGGSVYLSQSSITISSQQTATVSISGGTGTGYYVSTNTNSGVVTTSISGSILSVTSVANGNASITVCSQGSSVSCATLYVTVTGYGGSNGNVYLSPSTIVLNAGQSQTVSISNNTYNQYNYQNYYISNNSNPNYVSASISGSTLTVYGINSGASTITVCSSYNGSYNSGYNSGCASVYVSVNAPYGYTGTYYNNYNGYNGYNGYTGYNYNNQYPYNYYTQTYTYPTTYTSPTTYTYPTNYTYSYTPSYTSSVGTPVTGVFLNQIPSTGAGDHLKIILFVLGLTLWSLFVAYVLYAKYGGEITSVNDAIADRAVRFKMDQMKKRGVL